MSNSEKYKWYNSCNSYIEERLEEFLEAFYDSSEPTPLTNGYRMNPCPNCGHNDCSTFSNGQVFCFSCGWSGSFVSSYLDYAVEKTDLSKKEAIKKIEAFCHIAYPFTTDPKRKKEEEERERLDLIRKISMDFYGKQLLDAKKKYPFKGRKFTPLDYLKIQRGHEEETVKAFKVGFSLNYFVLREILLGEDFTKDEIKAAKVWFPEGLFLYPQLNPVTKEIHRINSKNPFGVTTEVKGKTVEVKGFSTGTKVMGFAPGFSFSKPIVVVEGEDDAQTVYELLYKNVSWIAGQLNDSQLAVMNRAKAPIYTMTDNDEVGEKYVKVINDTLPKKDVRRLVYNPNFSDPDEYLLKCETRKTFEELVAEAEILETEAFEVSKDKNVWTLEKRDRKIVFELKTLDDKTGLVSGNVKMYTGRDLKLKESKTNVYLSKLPNNFKPFNFYLEEHIEKYYNAPDGLDKKSPKDLIELYSFSQNKGEIRKAFAKIVYEAGNESDSLIVSLTNKLGSNAVDEILKEVNDLQNKGLIDSILTIPTLKLSHFFSIKNNDAYFYFTAIKFDGETVRRIPYLLRNDGAMLRLDLHRRKDKQCLLLIDNKYELPEEVNEAKMKLSECSLIADWAMKMSDGGVKEEEISPFEIVSEIESYLRRFYYHKDRNVHKIVALWIYGTYFYELFGQYPYLFLNGEKGSGKTVLDISIYLFALNAKLAVNISEAALYRLVSLEGGTIILDEIENLTSRGKTENSLMATILKGGYQKGSKAYRFNNDSNSTEGFEVYSPKVISNIYGVEDVLEDRCVRIDSQRMNVQEGIKLEDPKIYLGEKMNEIRAVTSRCAISALTHFKILYEIYEGSQMITENARLTQLLTPILALANFVDLSEGDPSFKGYAKNDSTLIEGSFTKAFKEYYQTNIQIAKKDIEAGTPEGTLKYVVNAVANELAGVVRDEDIEYTNPLDHKYVNPIEYNDKTGEFWLDAIHLKVFMEESLNGWNISTRQIHSWMKTTFGVNGAKRRISKLDNCSDELLKEFRDNRKPKVQHYYFNTKDFVEGQNRFTSEVVESYDEPEFEAPF